MEEQILETAKKLFFMEGKLHATMQDIAGELKVSRPVMNYYFRTRAALTERFYKEAVSCLSRRLDYIIELAATVYEGISNYIEDTLNHREEHTYLDTFMVIEMNCRPLTSDLSDYKSDKFF